MITTFCLSREDRWEQTASVTPDETPPPQRLRIRFTWTSRYPGKVHERIRTGISAESRLPFTHASGSDNAEQDNGVYLTDENARNAPRGIVRHSTFVA